jgi:tRNA G10  N-methylase Trm11
VPATRREAAGSEAAPALLQFGTDRALRRRLFVPDSWAHPAKLHLHLVQWLVERYTAPGDTILDPMGGIGSTLLAVLVQRDVVLYDVERRWLHLAVENARRIQRAAGVFADHATIRRHDARTLWPDRADHILCSPPYGCAMGTTPTAKRRLPARHVPRYGGQWRQMQQCPQRGAWGAYTFHYGQSEGQIGHFRGARYWTAMAQIYEQAYGALRPGGTMILVIKDHVQDGRHVPTAALTTQLCQTIGFVGLAHHRRRVWPLSLWQRRRREQGKLVIEVEDVLVFRRPRDPA